MVEQTGGQVAVVEDEQQEVLLEVDQEEVVEAKVGEALTR